MPRPTEADSSSVASADAVFAALGEPSRRIILERIAEDGAMTATDLAKHLPVTRQAVVQHLAALTDAGLLRSNRHGREVRYELTPDGLHDATRWITEVGAKWDKRLAALQRTLRRRKS